MQGGPSDPRKDRCRPVDCQGLGKSLQTRPLTISGLPLKNKPVGSDGQFSRIYFPPGGNALPSFGIAITAAKTPEDGGNHVCLLTIFGLLMEAMIERYFVPLNHGHLV